MPQTTHAHNPGRVRRFEAKIEPGPDDCWNWIGSLMPNGYGRFKGDALTPMLAHRWSYEYHVAPIPTGLDLDHLCRNRSCVNPWHLDPVTRSVNLKRGHHRNSAKTHCPQGHAYDSGNTLIESKGGRKCRICQRAAEARYRARRRAA